MAPAHSPESVAFRNHLPDSHIRELQRLESHYWWFVGRARWATELVTRWKTQSQHEKITYVDLGCGTGGFSKFIEEAVHPVETILSDHDPKVLSLVPQREHCTLAQIDLSRPFHFPKPPHLVSAMDVVEHLDDDRMVLTGIHDGLVKGGALVMSVPASPLLMSEWDVTLGHRRRYTVPVLRKVLTEAGFHVDTICPMWSFLYPTALVKRRLTKQVSGASEFPVVSPRLNSLLIELSALERKLSQIIPPPFGTSLIALAIKR